MGISLNGISLQCLMLAGAGLLNPLLIGEVKSEGGSQKFEEPSYVEPAPQKIEVTAGNAFRIHFIGNSITRHGVNEDTISRLGWDHVAGMAASSEDKDFAHRLGAMIQATMKDRKVELCFGKLSPDKPSPPIDLLVIQAGEHEKFGRTREDIAKDYEQYLLKTYSDLVPKPLILCVGVWAPSDNVPYGGRDLDVNEAYKSVCAKLNIPFVSVESLATDPTCRGWGTSPGVKWHPNDKGMEGYANLLFEAYQGLKNGENGTNSPKGDSKDEPEEGKKPETKPSASATDKNQAVTFQTDFSGEIIAIPNFRFDKSSWRIHDGILESVGCVSKCDSIEFGDLNWQDYEVEFQIRRTRLDPSDQHFSVFVRRDGDATSSLRFYCRGGVVFFIESAGKRENRHALLANMPKAMKVGENAPWTSFLVAVKGRQAKVYVDNQLIGEVSDLLPVSGKVSITAYNLDLQIKELKVTVNKFVSMPQKVVLSCNILHNSSFEQCTLDRLPDYWGCHHWGICDPYWVTHYDEWLKNYGVDENVAYDGKRSMRIENPFDKPDASGLVLRSCCLGTKANQKYMLSAYMKGQPEGMEVSFGGQKVKLSGDWKRYSTVFTNDGKSLYNDMLNIYPLGKGTFWIDAVQLEEGVELTAYARSMFEDQAVQTQEGNQEKTISEVPMLEPPRVKGGLSQNGRLDDPAWKNAASLSLVTTSGVPTSQRTEARILYDDNGIYIKIKCMDEKAGNNECKWLQRDGCVWEDPAIELFIDPNLTRNYYYHLAFNQKGIQYDSMCGDISWNGQWKVVTSTDPDGKSWNAEVFLPFGELGINRATGELWGLNICRYDKTVNENCCWSPTYGGYHKPERFGQIKIDKDLLDAYCFGCEEASLKLAAENTCALSMKVSNNSGKAGDFILESMLTDASGREVGRFEKPLHLGSPESSVLEFSEAVRRPESKYCLNVRLYSKDMKTLCLSKSMFVETPRLFRMISNYDLYTKESEMLLRLHFVLDGKSMEGAKVELTIHSPDGKEALKHEVDGLKSMMDVKLRIQDLECGSYFLKASLKSAGGKLLSTVLRTFRKLPPREHEVKIDRINRLTIADGRPFMPLGFAWEGDLTAEVLEYLSKSGCNTISACPSSAKEVLDNAAKYGIKIKMSLDAREKDKAVKLVETLKDHPALLAWDIFDEVFTGQWGKDNYELVKTRCAEVKELDPYHPVYINENQYGLSYLLTKNLDFPGDIVSIDYYAWMPSGNFQITSDYMRMMSSMGAADGRPCWIYLLGAGYAFWASRDYTPAEHEFSAYTSIINGGSGIFYFASHPKSESSWNRIKRIFRELDELRPVIASQEEAPPVKCSAPSIQILVKKCGDAIYIIAVNSSKEPVDARFDLSGLMKQPNGAKALFEERPVEVRNGVLADKFDGFQRHVYRTNNNN